MVDRMDLRFRSNSVPKTYHDGDRWIVMSMDMAAMMFDRMDLWFWPNCVPKARPWRQQKPYLMSMDFFWETEHLASFVIIPQVSENIDDSRILFLFHYQIK